jgi:fumarylpyruvate hydrolase
LTYVLPAWEPPSLAIAGSSERFPVRRIFCVGRNYAEHAREMGHDPDKAPPFFFMKPADALLPSGASLPYPPATRDLQHEVELVVAIAGGGHAIAARDALAHVYGYAVGLDMTRRDLQAAAKAAGRPWEAAKAFEGSAPVGALSPTAPEPEAAIWLKVNGEIRQQGRLKDMIWPVPEVIAQLSRLFTLKPGDLLFTGTPAGVSTVGPGDRLQGGVEGLDEVALTIR